MDAKALLIAALVLVTVVYLVRWITLARAKLAWQGMGRTSRCGQRRCSSSSGR